MITASVSSSNSAKSIGPDLNGIGRCPHCSVANPVLVHQWSSKGPSQRSDGDRGEYWGAFRCTTCGSICLMRSRGEPGSKFNIDAVFPPAKAAHEDIPEPARTFLQQAFETLHAPDAAAVMAGSAVDAMLKHHHYVEGTLYSRIDQALEANLLTKGMADWAHSVRLGSNRPRHADAQKPHVSREEAIQSVDFAEALGNFLFVLTARISRGIQAAKHADEAS